MTPDQFAADPPDNRARMACMGGTTIEEYSGASMVECIECGMRVRHDLVEDLFFGFDAGCPLKARLRLLDA